MAYLRDDIRSYIEFLKLEKDRKGSQNGSSTSCYKSIYQFYQSRILVLSSRLKNLEERKLVHYNERSK